MEALVPPGPSLASSAKNLKHVIGQFLKRLNDVMSRALILICEISDPNREHPGASRQSRRNARR